MLKLITRREILAPFYSTSRNDTPPIKCHHDVYTDDQELTSYARYRGAHSQNYKQIRKFAIAQYLQFPESTYQHQGPKTINSTNMSNQNDLLDIAAKAEQDLNSSELKSGNRKGASLSSKSPSRTARRVATNAAP